MTFRYIPNIITILRLILIVPFLMCMWDQQYVPAFFIFMLAGFSDGLDGFLARRYQWTSPLGSFLDPLADKLLVMSSFFILAYLRRVPLWLCALVVFRDLMIMTGVGGLFAMLHQVEFKPSLLSKINTAIQVLVIACLLFELAFALLPDQLIEGLVVLMMFTTITSLIHYVWVNSVMVYRRRHA